MLEVHGPAHALKKAGADGHHRRIQWVLLIGKHIANNCEHASVSLGLKNK
jgi:hypothetical protein